MDRNLCNVIVLAAGLGWASAGQAQMNPELGDVDNPPPADQGGFSGAAGGGFTAGDDGQAGSTWQPPTAPAQGQTGGAEASDADSDGKDDHQQVVGRFGIGFFGTQTIPVMGCNSLNCEVDFDNTLTVLAPTVGARYWLSDLVGLEASVGFHHSGGDTEITVDDGTMATTTKVVGPSVTGFALHAGVPLALAHKSHFVFQVVPQLNFGISGGSYEGPSPAEKWNISGLMFDVGATAGAEIHFGFINLPQLALQASIGLFVRTESRSAEQPGDTNAAPPIPKTTVSQGRTEVRTSLEGEPWDIFTGAISAIYYL